MAEATRPTADLQSVVTPQLQMMQDQLRRTPYALIFCDSIIAWMMMRTGTSAWIIAWVVISAALQFMRASTLRGLDLSSPKHVGYSMRVINIWFLVVGLTRVWPIGLIFSGQTREDDYLITIIMIGLAAGGVSTAAGIVRSYLCWAMPVATALVLGWMSRNTFEGMWIAALLVAMFALLTRYVHTYGNALEQLRQQVQRASDERDRAEAAQARADEERGRAEKAVLSKSRFFAAASHDLRQPLSVLRWYGDAVRVHADRLKHPQLQAIGDGIGRALEHAEPLVGKYLDIAKIEAGALELAPRSISVARLFEQIKDAFSHDVQTRQLSLNTHFGSNIAQLVVFADESILRSILDNLVGNAIKFTASGGVTLFAERVDGAAGPCVRIGVRDTGLGIHASEHERVFEDFYQLDNPDRGRSRGLGLGLAIVRRQAELLGTTVRLVSAVGQGSTFEFDLPVATQAKRDDTGLANVALAWGVTERLRVLVIDDEPEVRTALRLMLESVRWDVRTAGGLTEAIAEVDAGYAPDVLVVDHRLHGAQTGVEVIAELRCSGCDAPAIIVTGDTSPEQLVALRQTGLPVLHKPVQGGHLITAIVTAATRRAIP